MSILKTCNIVLHGELLGFLAAMDNVISWGGGEFLDHKAKQMGKVVPGEACCSEAGWILG